jgi:hypothetical protein
VWPLGGSHADAANSNRIGDSTGGNADEAATAIANATSGLFIFALLMYLTVHPMFDVLRPDPRYADVVRRMNLA